MHSLEKSVLEKLEQVNSNLEDTTNGINSNVETLSDIVALNTKLLALIIFFMVCQTDIGKALQDVIKKMIRGS